MNKYLLMSAAAVMASASSIATPSSAGSTNIGYSGYCDGESVNTADNIVYAGKHLFTGCAWSSPYHYTAVAGKNKKFNSVYGGGKKFFYAENYATFSFAYGYAIQLPVASGNHWTGFATSNATSGWEFNAGTYFTGYAPGKGQLKSSPASNKAVKARIASK